MSGKTVVKNEYVRLSEDLASKLQPWVRQTVSFIQYPEDPWSARFNLNLKSVGHLWVTFNFLTNTKPSPDQVYKLTIKVKHCEGDTTPYRTVRFDPVEDIETNLKLHFATCEKGQEKDLDFGFVPSVKSIISGYKQDVILFTTANEQDAIRVKKLSKQRLIGYLKSGEKVFDHPMSHVQEGTIDFFKKALSLIQSRGRRHISKEIDFGFTIGDCICVETDNRDQRAYAERVGRNKFVWLVLNREAVPCSYLSLVLRRSTDGNYSCSTAYIGYLVRSATYWETHALLIERVKIIPETLVLVGPKD